MRKPLKLFGAMISLLALTACQDLGSEIDATEAKKQQAKISEAAEQKAPNAYSFTAKVNVNMNMNLGAELGGKVSAKESASAYAAYNVDKLYGYVSEKIDANTTQNGKAQKENGKLEGWVYYKDGALYAVRNETDEAGKATKVYSKTAMTEAEAKLRFEGIFVDSYYEGMLDLNYIKQLADTFSSSLDSYVSGAQGKSSIKYYSKGDGNLSLTADASASYSEKGQGSLKYSLKFTATIDNYLLTNASESVSLSMKDTKSEVLGAKVSLSIKGSKSCSVSYPSLTGYAEGNVAPEDVAQIDLGMVAE